MPPDNLFWLLSLIPIIWIAMCLVVSTIGGWRLLARSYRAPGSVTGKRFWLQSGRLRWGVGYDHGLRVTVNKEGLGVSVLFILRIGHPPLFFPWSDITIGKSGFWFWTVRLHFSKEPAVPFTISKRLARKIAAAARDYWPSDDSSSEKPRDWCM